MSRKSTYQEDVRKSQTIKGTVCPKWQEEFELLVFCLSNYTSCMLMFKWHYARKALKGTV